MSPSRVRIPPSPFAHAFGVKLASRGKPCSPVRPSFGPPAIECLPHPRARSRVRQRRLGRFPLRAKRRGRDLNPRRTFQHVRDFQSRSLDHSDTSPGDAQRIHSREKARRRAASYHPRPEGWQSGRMRRSRKPLSVVRRIEGSNPSPSVICFGNEEVTRYRREAWPTRSNRDEFHGGTPRASSRKASFGSMTSASACA